ncbi:histidine ammonia-lyase [candidate division KSB3 bacterium]|uniref:Histidine ammonia-lyase n=1 Tax=candidate division KSB3 bacterium TaxID=2044937 RepID=A0A9D5JXI5_9BACT|nr:histidine ammonia-lyase [candidate division KSB3 bacterium]MBD3326139.1 histidine ammonia-lyase [candidate division KSB3 bacterium]
MNVVMIDGEHLTLEQAYAVAVDNVPVELSSDAVTKIVTARDYVERLVEEDAIVYGVTTGFGKFSHVKINHADVLTLQENLIMSHQTGVGEPFPEDVVRAIMLLRINTLAKGYSGVRPCVIQTLIDMLNKRVHPLIPRKGSVGASGDLAPLAHLAGVLIGKGEAWYNGHRLPGADAMKRAGIQPVQLQAKEGLALINGTQVMTGLGVFIQLQAERLAKILDIAGAITLEALKGTDTAFLELTHRVRPHRGQSVSAKNFLKLHAQSEIIQSHKNCTKVQDAYSLRCMPQVHGATKDVLRYVRSVLDIEINSATDNPLIFPDEEKVISCGNFHGQPIAMALDFLAIGLAELADISERRIEHLVDPDVSGLPGFLVKEGGLNSGFMIAQVTAVSLVSENKILAHPASVDSIPTSANQEDHVSMGTTAAVKAFEVLQNVQHVAAIELLCGVQGLDFLQPLTPGLGVRTAYDIIRTSVPYLDRDRPLHLDIQRCLELIINNTLLQAVEEAVGTLEI